MLKTHWRIISWLQRLGDNLIIISAFLVSYFFRDYFFHLARNLNIKGVSSSLVLAPIESYLVVIAAAWPIFNFVLEIMGGYRSMRLSSIWQLLKMSVAVTLLVFFFLGAILYFLKFDLSRSFVALFCILSGLGIFIERIVILQLLRFFRVRGKNFRNILIVGTGEQARNIFFEVTKEERFGLKVAGFVEVSNEKDSGYSKVYDLHARVIADPETYEEVLKKHAIDEVLFTDVLENRELFKEFAEIAVEEGVRVTVAADFFSLGIFQSDVSYFGETPLLHYAPSAGAAESPAHLVKRMIDVVISSLLLILLLPFLLFISLLIKLTSPGPIFFKQKRVGLNGRLFTLLKFRSMVKNAEELLATLTDRNEMNGPVFKITDDPRITPLGKFLRKYSLDELPQLFNVFVGDMSLVGPRPPLPTEVSRYRRKQRKRLSMRPGLTCTWQISGRNNIPDFEKWAELDLEYIDNWSLRRDLELLLKTIPVVISGSGAK
ncbi:MAG: sugar transferase [Proteobacteria bacterium]|nr:sugar transferase [Pseudomonadota bacterium]